jgi:hypothetical protein
MDIGSQLEAPPASQSIVRSTYFNSSSQTSPAVFSSTKATQISPSQYTARMPTSPIKPIALSTLPDFNGTNTTSHQTKSVTIETLMDKPASPAPQYVL